MAVLVCAEVIFIGKNKPAYIQNMPDKHLVKFIENLLANIGIDYRFMR